MRAGQELLIEKDLLELALQGGVNVTGGVHLEMGYPREAVTFRLVAR